MLVCQCVAKGSVAHVWKWEKRTIESRIGQAHITKDRFGGVNERDSFTKPQSHDIDHHPAEAGERNMSAIRVMTPPEEQQYGNWNIFSNRGTRDLHQLWSPVDRQRELIKW